MSVFEIVMLICFGSSWPFSIYRVWRTKCATGKSIVFLVLIVIGYLAGITHKLTHPGAFDYVIFLYVLNAVMVGVDLLLCIKYLRVPLAAGVPSE